MLQDDTYAVGSCICALRSDATGTCTPDPSNDVFTGYWDDCDSNNEITDQVTYDYWAQYITYWAYLQTNLDCGSFLQELAQMTTLAGEYNSAAALALAIGLVF